jgi:HAD superfamily hydrolase (TIGR01509 family)
MIHAIFFDFNGVIIDDEPLQLRAYQEAFEPEGMALTEKDYYDALGMDDRTFVRTIYERAGKPLDEDTMRAVIERKSDLHRRQIEDELPLFPGVVTFVKHVARYYQLGISSMARRVEINDVLKRARLDSAFTVIVSAEDAPVCKPDPCCYHRAFELLNERRRAAGSPAVKPEECLVIEDSPPGIESGRRAGMRTLGVTNTVSEEALRSASAEVVTRSLADWNVDAIHHIFDE